MFTMGLVLAIVMAIFEIYCHRSFPRLGKMIERSATNSLIFSVALSIFMGMLFPSTGVISLMGAVGGTVLVQPYYLTIRTSRKVKAKVIETKAKRQSK